MILVLGITHVLGVRVEDLFWKATTMWSRFPRDEREGAIDRAGDRLARDRPWGDRRRGALRGCVDHPARQAIGQPRAFVQSASSR